MVRRMAVPFFLAVLWFVLPGCTAAGEPGEATRLVPTFDGSSDSLPQPKADSAIRRTAFSRLADTVRPTPRVVRSGRETSLLDRWGRKTRSMLSKTKSVLTPWDESERSGEKRSLFSVWRSDKDDSQEKKSLFSSWFSRAEPKPPPSTVSDWLAQPRP